MFSAFQGSLINLPLAFRSINITVPRVGGGFGGKSVDSSTVASAVSLAAFLSKRLGSANYLQRIHTFYHMQ